MHNELREQPVKTLEAVRRWRRGPAQPSRPALVDAPIMPRLCCHICPPPPTQQVQDFLQLPFFDYNTVIDEVAHEYQEGSR